MSVYEADRNWTVVDDGPEMGEASRMNDAELGGTTQADEAEAERGDEPRRSHVSCSGGGGAREDNRR
eukprot:CAMPEP_0197452708 /NCGR_PEP_ID=MMETSP1175-20131217/32754_1 /TAXON_ID=1003142 /ORGANISM="Triceratium dubium, Strain CCMP147" /LENGTH=66 /DNA_ID=CAMNT_0042985775 /DNA_START=140 /DNA_END=336 /DNA_ORIENTATION=+